MIIVDFSQILIANASIGFKQYGGNLTENDIRNLFLNSIVGMRKKYIDKYGGPFILACDGKGYWRKDIFPYYKMKRATSRADSPMDWELIFNTLNKIYDEIQEYFPYHLIKVDGLEGDDVIAALVKYFNTNELINDGLFERRHDILILSADEDFLQLQQYGNVSQWSPIKKRFIRSPDPIKDQYEKIIRGDAGDGVVNIFSDDDTFAVPGKRQRPASKGKVEPLLESLVETGKLPEDVDPIVQRNFDRNNKLINLVDIHMPPELYEEVIRQYKETDTSDSKGKLFQYFTKFGLKNLMKDIDKF